MLTLVRSAAAATFLVIACALAASAQTTAPPAVDAAPAPSASPTTAPENPLITARVTREFAAWQRGKINRAMYSPNAGGTYIDALVAVIAPDLQAIGAPQTTQYRSASLLLGDLVYRYDVIGANGTVSVLYSLDQAGKTDGIEFTPLTFQDRSLAP